MGLEELNAKLKTLQERRATLQPSVADGRSWTLNLGKVEGAISEFVMGKLKEPEVEAHLKRLETVVARIETYGAPKTTGSPLPSTPTPSPVTPPTPTPSGNPGLRTASPPRSVPPTSAKPPTEAVPKDLTAEKRANVNEMLKLGTRLGTQPKPGAVEGKPTPMPVSTNSQKMTGMPGKSAEAPPKDSPSGPSVLPRRPAPTSQPGTGTTGRVSQPSTTPTGATAKSPVDPPSPAKTVPSPGRGEPTVTAKARTSEEEAQAVLAAQTENLRVRAEGALQKLDGHLPAEKIVALKKGIASKVRDEDVEQLIQIVKVLEAEVQKRKSGGAQEPASGPSEAARKKAADEAAVKEAARKKAAEEAALKEAARKKAAEEAALKEAARKKAADEAAVEESAVEKLRVEATDLLEGLKAAISPDTFKGLKTLIATARVEKLNEIVGKLEARQAVVEAEAKKAADELAAKKAADALAAKKAADELAAKKAADELAAKKAADALTAKKSPAATIPVEPGPTYEEVAAKIEAKLPAAQVQALKTLATKNTKLAATVAGIFEGLEDDYAKLALKGKSVEELAANVTKAKQERKLAAAKLTAATEANVKAAAALKAAQPGSTAYKTANTKVGESFAEATAAKEKIAELDQKIGPAEKVLSGKALLLEAVQFGPLSRPAAPEDDPVVAAARTKAASDIIKNFKDHPATAYDALDLVRHTKHPEVIAKGVAAVGPLEESLFATKPNAQGGFTHQSPHTARAMARNALAMGGLMGGDYFEGMEAFYRDNKHAAEDPLAPKTDSGGKAKGTAYTKKLVGDLVGADGKVNFAAAGLKPTLDNLKFHPGSLKTPLFAFAANLEDVRQKFTDPPAAKNDYVKKLATVKKPKDGADGENAKGLVRQCLGLEDGHEPTDVDAQRAVMSALLTPFAQGDVGSCFATGPCLKFKEADPLAFMSDLGEIVENGTLKKGTDPAQPVITNLPSAKKDNPLMRSWEYTVATVGARKENSHEKKKITDALFGDASKQNLAAVAPGKKREITAAVGKAFTFSYDPVTKLEGISADGSSSKGKWALMHVNKDGEEELVDDEDKYLAHLKAIVAKELDITDIQEVEEGLDPDAEAAQKAERDKKLDLKKKLDDLFEPPKKADFVMHMCEGFDKGKGAPWKMSGGGRGEGPTEVLFGKGPLGEVPKEEKFFDPTGPAAHKAGALLSSMVKGVQGATAKHVTVSISGIHGMNLMPAHPSLAKLQPETGKTVEDKVAEHLIRPGVEIAKKQTPERTAALHGRAVASVLGPVFEDDEAGLAGVTPPPAGKTPAELKTFIMAQVKARIEANVAKEITEDPKILEKGVQKKFAAVKAKHDAACAKIRKSDAEARAALKKKDAAARAKMDTDHVAAQKKVNADYEAAFEKYREDHARIVNRHNAANENYTKLWAEYKARGNKPPLPPQEPPKAPTLPEPPDDPVYPPKPTYPPASPIPPASPMPAAPKIEDHKASLAIEFQADLTKQRKEQVENGIDNVLMKELAPPEFVIANTNWGTQTGRTFHVIAPDPCDSTGAPALWKKEEPAGTYTRETADWLTKDWSVMKKGTEFT